MKRTISFILITTLIFMSVALSSCKKEIYVDTTETALSDTEVSSGDDTSTTSTDIDITAEAWYDEQGYYGTEHTTNSNYQKDYDALTLPPPESDPSAPSDSGTAPTDNKTDTDGKSTTKADTSDKEQETDKNSPDKPTDNKTTTKETTTQKPSGKETTTKESVTKESTTTDSGDTPGSLNPAPIPRPNVTYFDKYVRSVLNSGNYTATVNGTFRGHKATVNIYKNGGTAYKISTTHNRIPVSFRYFYSGGNVYIVAPTEMSYAIADIADPVVGALESVAASESVAMLADGMEYCGMRSATGSVIESYRDSDGTYYHYHFTSGGLSKIVTSGPDGNSTITVSLFSGVTDGGVFSVPKSYKQVDVQVFIDKFESLS
ncbi:MAG: hypothetical protein IJB86_04850 [Clostridia bacterium]|nr:hypothetical protein [Clostridia bacterium]